MSARKSETVNLRMTPELKQLLRLVAERGRRTFSNKVEVSILAYCQQSGIQPEASVGNKGKGRSSQ